MNLSNLWEYHHLSILFGMSGFLAFLALMDVLLFSSSKRFWMGWAVLIVFSCAALAYTMGNFYTGEGINEAVLFQLKYGAIGVGWNQMQGWVYLAGFGLFCLLVLFGLSLWLLKRRRSTPPAISKKRNYGALSAAGIYVLSLVVNPGIFQSAGLASHLLHRGEYQAELAKQNRPIQLPVKHVEHPKSVVYIYMESFEGTFLDERLFPGLTPNLNAMRKNALVLSNIQQAPFTGWTIAGMVASQCGFPALQDQDFTKKSAQGIACTGDILQESGYNTSYVNGARLSFVGQGDYYRSHHFTNVIGRDEIEAKRTLSTTSEWGLFDDDLLQETEKEFDRLAAKRKPFLLISPTLDTHTPGGYPTPYCSKVPHYGDGKNSMLNAVHCSDQLVGLFLKKLQDKHIPNVIFVVGNDHLQPNSSLAIDQLRRAQDGRRDMWMATGAGIKPEVISRAGTTFDIAPTLLSLMGFDVPVLHLGRDLRRSQPTMVETFGMSRFSDRVESVFVVGTDGFWRQDASTTPADHMSDKAN